MIILLISSQYIFEDDQNKRNESFQMKKNLKGNHVKNVDFSKPVLEEGKLNVQKKNGKFEPKLFKLIDKKLIFYRVKTKKAFQ